VPAIDEYTVKIENLGGKVVLPKTAVPGIGYFAVCLDTEDNIFAIWETDDSAK
jgi:predicted enzyme related to lactoylglutathione lyase